MKTLNEIRQSVFTHSSAAVQNQAPLSFVSPAVSPSIHLCPPVQGSQRLNASNSLRERALSNSSNRSAGSKRNRDEVSSDDNSDSWATVAAGRNKKKPKTSGKNSKLMQKLNVL